MSATNVPKRGYAWQHLHCGHAVAWDDRLGPLAPCRECDRLSQVARGELEALEGHLQALSERVERGPLG